MPIIALVQEELALLLANYLKSQGFKVSLARDADKFVLYSLEEKESEYIRAICSEFVKQPHAPKYQRAAWESDNAFKIDFKKKLFRKDILSWFNGAPITFWVLFICSTVFILANLGMASSLFSALQILPLDILLDTHEWWRVTTPAIIHFSVLHFAFNLLWWTVLGRSVELSLGSVFLLFFFLICAITSNISQLIIVGPNFGGLSGVVYALVGFVWVCGLRKPEWKLNLHQATFNFLMIWLVIGYLDVLWVSMANIAHTAGLISGCLLAYFFTLKKS